MGITAKGIFGKAHQIQKVFHLLMYVVPVSQPMIQHGFCQDFKYMLSRVQGGIGILEHHLQLGADGLQLRFPHMGQIPALIQDTSAGGLLQAHNLSAQGGLAAAGLTNQSQGLAFMD